MDWLGTPPQKATDVVATDPAVAKLRMYRRRMRAVWGIHNDQSSLDLVSGGFISIGWEELGDLSDTPADRDLLKQMLTQAYPNEKPGAIPI